LNIPNAEAALIQSLGRCTSTRNDFEKLDYFYKLTTKEIVLHQFEGAPPVNVLEKLIDIQLAREKAPPGL
jgi:hypothetical protein